MQTLNSIVRYYIALQSEGRGRDPVEGGVGRGGGGGGGGLVTSPTPPQQDDWI